MAKARLLAFEDRRWVLEQTLRAPFVFHQSAAALMVSSRRLRVYLKVVRSHLRCMAFLSSIRQPAH